MPSLAEAASQLLHERERDDVPYAGAVSEQHDQAVDAEPHAPSRRHAVLEGRDEVLVQLDLSKQSRIASCSIGYRVCNTM